MIEGVRRVQDLMEQERYVTDRAIATTVFLAMELRKPILIEGPAGVGKTEVAKVLSQALETRLIRLQCYEGLDANTALYEWNFPKQMLRMRIEEGGGLSTQEKEHLIFSESFLFKRPLLEAITEADQSPVLLIDEVDRADEEFEAFLLEVLSDFQVTIPELGTIKADHRPYVVLTSNRTRELSDALKRRCLYLWIDYPSYEKEVRIIRNRVPKITEQLAAQVAAFMQVARELKLTKVPGIAETIDWAVSLMALHQEHLEAESVSETLGCLFKDHEDIVRYAGPRMEKLVGALAAVPFGELPEARDRVLAAVDGSAGR
ncbi:MAG: ATPase associated with various cellular activity 5 [Chloroflexi bacterium]|nr:ATPase associated with various cellular activity 5 [Chloroflexota bacterium]